MFHPQNFFFFSRSLEVYPQLRIFDLLAEPSLSVVNLGLFYFGIVPHAHLEQSVEGSENSAPPELPASAHFCYSMYSEWSSPGLRAKILGHTTIESLIRNYISWNDKLTPQRDEELRRIQFY